MAPRKPKPLTHSDTISEQEVHTARYQISEETAQKMGYPSAKIYLMEVRLAELAQQWHQTHNVTLLEEYHKLYYKMIVFGYKPESFAPETEIDTAYMPELPPKLI